MELVIYSPQGAEFPKEIKWNHEELKAQILPKVREYASSVYTDDSISKARSDRADLRKFVDALKKERTAVRKKLLAPDELFGKQVDELTGLIQTAISNIDDQVKGYEQRQRDERMERAKEIYDANIGDLAEYLPWERVKKTEYSLSSASVKSVTKDIQDLIAKVREGLDILDHTDSEYVADMKAVFLDTYDISMAMAKRNQLETEAENRRLYMEEQKRQEAERELKRKVEAERLNRAGKENAELHPEEVKEPEQTYEIDFRVTATAEQLHALKEFLKSNGIQYGPVPKQ